MATSPSTELHDRPGVRLPTILQPIDRVLESRMLPLSLAHRWKKPDFLGLCYHNVAEPVDPLTHFGYDYKRPAELEQDLRTLSRRFGIADATAFAHEASPRPDCRGQALLTFDDGHRQWRDVVLPIMQRQRVVPVMFVASATIGNRYLLPSHVASLSVHTLVMQPDDERERRLRLARSALGLAERSGIEVVCDALRARGTHEGREGLIEMMQAWGFDVKAYLADERPYLDETQLRELAAAGCVLGAHSIDHRSLHDVPFAEVERQVTVSCAVIREITGQAVVPFAFPYSRRVAAAPLADLRRRNPWIGCYFGTSGLRPAPEGFQERIVADWRFGNGPRQRDDALLTLCSRAYLRHLAQGLRRSSGTGLVQ